MRILRKTIAGICAAVMCSVTGISAFAAEQTDDPIALLETYLEENGVSEEDKNIIIQSYIAGSVQTYGTPTIDAEFYNASHLASTQHYLLAITPNRQSFPEAAIIETYETNYVSCDASQVKVLTECDSFDYCGTQSSTFAGMDGKRMMFVLMTRNTKLSWNALFTMPVQDVNSSITTELQLKNQMGSAVGSTNNYVVYETYALGDINHDGYVDDKDSKFLADFLIKVIDSFELTYLDYDTNYSGYTNYLAADFNQNGEVNLADLVSLSRYLEQKSN